MSLLNKVAAFRLTVIRVTIEQLRMVDKGASKYKIKTMTIKRS
jgi:hypothetical protein